MRRVTHPKALLWGFVVFYGFNEPILEIET